MSFFRDKYSNQVILFLFILSNNVCICTKYKRCIREHGAKIVFLLPLSLSNPAPRPWVLRVLAEMVNAFKTFCDSIYSPHIGGNKHCSLIISLNFFNPHPRMDIYTYMYFLNYRFQRERKWGERKREKQQCEREASVSCFPYVP